MYCWHRTLSAANRVRLWCGWRAEAHQPHHNVAVELSAISDGPFHQFLAKIAMLELADRLTAKIW